MVRIPEALARQLDLLAARNVTGISAEASRAVRELLEKEGLWPPPGLVAMQ